MRVLSSHTQLSCLSGSALRRRE